MAVVKREKLLSSGIQFGHKTDKWNPKMDKYIFNKKGDIHIIDLNATIDGIENAYTFVKEKLEKGGDILFVGTKKQAADGVKAAAEKAGMYYVNKRWLGGILTNYKTIKNRIAKIEEFERMEQDGTFDRLPKKEVLKMRKQYDKLVGFLGGIRDMKKLPAVIFVVDVKKEINAIKEAKILNIPVVGLVDTNNDPDVVDVIIPGNDDSMKAVALISELMANAAIEARGEAVFTEDLEVAAPAQAEAAPVQEVKVEEVVEAAPAATEEVDFASMKVVELREFAKANDIKLTKTKKDEIIEEIKSVYNK
jgi:small subunit ribosomal protein S2